MPLVYFHVPMFCTPAYAVPERFSSMVEPHLKSYNYFLTHGMANVVEGMEPFEVKLKSHIRTPLHVFCSYMVSA